MKEIVYQLENLVIMLTNLKPDVLAFENKGNMAAGTRVTKAMQEAKKSAQTIRESVFAAKKNN